MPILRVMNANPNTPLAERARLNNFYIALHNENDPKSAVKILDEIETSADLSTPSEISDAEQALRVYVDPKTGEMPYIAPGVDGSDQLPILGSQPMSDGVLANYPNPFNPTTKVSYALAKSGYVTMKVYDILGREVATLVDEYQSVGLHSATFDGTHLASGVYFCRLTAPGINRVKKMLLTK